MEKNIFEMVLTILGDQICIYVCMYASSRTHWKLENDFCYFGNEKGKKKKLIFKCLLSTIGLMYVLRMYDVCMYVCM